MTTLTQTIWGQFTGKQKIYGMEYNVYLHPELGEETWQLLVNHPFERTKFGLNEKLLRTAITKGVKRFVLGSEENYREFLPPDEKELKRKIRKEEFNWQKSLFQGMPDYRIFHFSIT